MKKHIFKVMEKLEAKIGYTFKDSNILEEALTHKSFVNENRGKGLKDNERLEFLGDAVLELVVSELLFSLYPDLNEGELSKRRAALVREEALSGIALELGLGDYILMGKGEALSGGREKSSLLSNTFEAMVAAVYLDGGFNALKLLIDKLFIPLLSSPPSIIDFKSRLQETCHQEKRGEMHYRVTGEEGPDHDKTFEVSLDVDGKVVSCGRGKSIKEAEQMAAKEALKELFNHD